MLIWMSIIERVESSWIRMDLKMLRSDHSKIDRHMVSAFTGTVLDLNFFPALKVQWIHGWQRTTINDLRVIVLSKP